MSENFVSRAQTVVKTLTSQIDVKVCPEASDIIGRDTDLSPEELALAHVKNISGPVHISLKKQVPDPFLKDEIKISLISEHINLRYKYRFAARACELSSVRVAETCQGSGFYKAYFANNLSLFDSLAIENIDIIAQNVGRYASLKYGFKPSPDSWDDMKDYLQMAFNDVKAGLSSHSIETAQKALNSDDPKAAWMIADLDEPCLGERLGPYLMSLTAPWEGALDLTDDNCRRRCEDYVGQAGPQAQAAAF